VTTEDDRRVNRANEFCGFWSEGAVDAIIDAVMERLAAEREEDPAP